MDYLKMDTQKGTKWFTFYTKIRPWLAIITACGVLGDFLQYTEVYLQYWWLWIYVLLAIATSVVQICVFVKSRGDYIKFVRFVEGALILDVVTVAYQTAVQRVVTDTYGEIGIAVFFIVLAIGYFLWYRLNKNYFRKRVRKSVWDNAEFRPDSNDPNQVNVVVEGTNSNYCTQCGQKIDEQAQTCPICGSIYAQQRTDKSFRVLPIKKSNDFVDENGWVEEITGLETDEVYRRYCDAEEWAENYRALCYEELLKRNK